MVTAAAATSPRGRWATLMALCAADFLVVLDGLIVAVALPAIQDDLAISTGTLQWVVTAYLLPFGGLLLLGGRLGDLFGRRRVLLVGLTLFGIGALMAGLAWAPAALFAGRAVQGSGAAMMAPTALALLGATFSAGSSRNRALGLWSAAGSIGIPAGALLGGVLTASFGWRAVLLVSVPAAVGAAVATRWVVPESADPDAPRGLDLPGAALVTGAVTLLVFGVVNVEHIDDPIQMIVRSGVPVVAAVTLLAGLVAVERQSRNPLIPPDTFALPGLTRANVAGAALPVGLGAVLFLGTLQMQRLLGLDPLQTGLAYLVITVPIIAASPLAARLTTRLGRARVAVAGYLLQSAGLALLSRIDAGAAVSSLATGFVLVGIGAPLAFVPVTAAALDAPEERSGLASGVFNTVQQVGNALALAVIATLTAATQTLDGAPEPDDPASGYGAGFLLAASICLIWSLAAARLSDRRHRPDR